MNGRMRYVALLVAFIIAIPTAIYAQQPYDVPEEVVTGETIFEEKSLLSPGCVTVIRPENMKGEQKNLPELLRRVPGLHIVEARGRGAYTVASVRGSTSAQVSVFVDGTLMNLASEPAVDLTTIPVDNVEKIEVYRGYVPAKFAGAAMGGVINIITKKPVKREGEVSVGTGSFGKVETNVSYSQKFGDGKLLFGGNFERSDGDFKYHNDNGTMNPDDDYEAKRYNNYYKNKDFLLKWHNRDWQLRASYKDNKRELPRPAAGSDDPRFPSTLDSATMDTEQYLLSAGRRFTTGKIDWGIKADWLKQNKIYDNPNAPGVIGGGGEVHNEFETHRMGLALDGALPVGENQLIEFLGNYSNEKMDVSGDVLFAIQSQLDHPIDFFRRENYDLQLQDTITLNEAGNFWLTPIARYNWVDGDGETSFGVALSKEVNDNISVKATYGSYNRAPNLYEKYGDGAMIRPNANLHWESGNQWDLSVAYTGKFKGIDLYTELAYFGRHSDNLIEFFLMSPRYGKYLNVGKAEVNGVEFEANALYKSWELYASATYMKAISKTDTYLYNSSGEVLNDSFNYSEGKRLPNRPRYEGLVRLTKKFMDNRLSAYTEVHYHGSNYFGSVEDVLMEKYVTTDFGINWRIKDGIKLTCGVEDIFNQTMDMQFKPTIAGITRMMYYPLQGRTYFATLSWYF